jgi:hypothetical protein
MARRQATHPEPPFPVISRHRKGVARPEPPLPVVIRRKPKKADGGPITDPDILTKLNAPAPVTDPETLKQLNAPDGPWADYSTKPPFDPSKPYQATKPAFDPSKPYTDATTGRVLSDADMGTEPKASLYSVALQVPTGFNEFVANGLGAPVDAMTWALNQIPSVKIKDPVLGSEFIKKGMGLIGANPDNAPARNAPERIARGTGSGVGGMLVPEAVFGTLGELGVLPKVTGALRNAFGASETLPATAGNVAVGALSGAGGSTASEFAPAPYKPLAETGGNLAGGVLGTSGVAATRGIRWAADAVKDYFAPLTEKGQEQAAAKTLANRATSQAALRDSLDNPPAELVPGSQPTTFQQTGDMGLGGLEREVAAQNPADFMQRRADQNAARVDALQSVERNGSPTDVSNAIRQQLQTIDQMTGDALSQATEAAAGRVEALGGNGTSEGYGASLRDYAAQARASAKEQERALWRAVDPDNKLALPVTPLQEAAQGLEKSVSPSAKPIAGEERAVLDTIGRYPNVMPFSEITDLRSRVSAAMRDELRASGETPVYARLSRLRGAIENTIAGAVEYKAAQEAQAVARGELAPEDAIAARVQDWRNVWYSRQAEAGALNRAGARGNAGAGSTTISGPRGAASQAGERFGSSASDKGLSRDVPLQPNFDQAARDRLNAATAATRDRKQTFDTGPVGQVLRPAGMQGQYRTVDAGVPATIFKRGPTGFQSVQAYQRAVGNPQAMGVLGDYAAASLRKAAAKPDGTLDPARFATWQKAHADALRAMPELAARFEDAASASRAIEDVAAIRREALEHYQRGAFGQLANASTPEDITRIVGGLFGQRDSAKAMRDLVAETRNNPAAREGLRKAIADHILNKFISNTEAGSSEIGLIRSNQFQNFVRDNAAALRQVFSEQEVNSMRAIAADLQRANRSITAVKLPGGSNTAQDQAATQLSLLSRIIHHGRDAAVGATAGFGATAPFGLGPIGALAGTVGGSVVTAFRDAGMKRVDDLVRDALLNPELARRLLAKIPSNAKTGQMGLVQYLRRNTAAALFDQDTRHQGN